MNDKGEIVEHGRVVYRIFAPRRQRLRDFEIAYSNETKLTSLHGWSITGKGPGIWG